MDDETKTRANEKHEDDLRSVGAKMKRWKESRRKLQIDFEAEVDEEEPVPSKSDAFIEGQIAQLVYAGIGSLSAVAMKGVS